MPRASHAEWEPSSARPDPIGLLEQQAQTRVPELVPIRYGRMLVSPFTFYRGAALIMASDLAATPRAGVSVQLCGDAHLSNFGIFGTPERNMMFDVNDFDETHPGPWEWDVKRLAVSLVAAGRDRGFSAKQRGAVVLAAVAAYRTAMREFAAKTNLEVWYAHLDVEKTVAEYAGEFSAAQVAKTDAAIAKARTKDSLQAFAKLTHLVDGEPRIISDPPLIVPVEELFEGRELAGPRAGAEGPVPRLPPYAHDRPSPAARAVRPRPHRAQGRRCRQRRYPRLDRALPRPRRERSALPAGQGGGGVGARAVPRPERVQQLLASASSPDSA